MGTLEVRHSATLESLQDPQRDTTHLFLFNAVEPKNARTHPPPNQPQPRFPDTIEVQCSIATSFNPGHAPQQDPAPAFTCSVGHDTQILYVSAPYASVVFNGKDVTADPPRTELWALL